MSAGSVTLEPGRLRGTVAAPPSKSAAHRAILCAALAAIFAPREEASVLSPLDLSDDIRATLGAVRALGAETVSENGATLRQCFFITTLR